MALSDRIKSPLSTEPIEPPWYGPMDVGEKGGITFSLLSRYLACPERFRILTMDGWKVADTFNHRLEFGSMFHVCEEHYLAGKPSGRATPASLDWRTALQEYARGLCKKYPLQQEQVNHWYRVCLLQFPEYIKFWERQKKMMPVKTLLQEYIFHVAYILPSKRVVYLRGKWDSVDLIGTGNKTRLVLQENKTKGEINQEQIVRQLSFDAQTMLYLTALSASQDDGSLSKIIHGMDRTPPITISGVRYNVIRRPLSGGKGTIVRHKPSKSNPRGESEDEYYLRVAKYIQDEPESYFMRWDVGVTLSEINTFRHQCLDPVLENLCDAYEWWQWCRKNNDDLYNGERRAELFMGHCPRHFRMPYGIYSTLTEGIIGDLDSYLYSGSTVGLQRTTNLFPELS